jgi:branched-chain amino acid aminotransferase
MASAYVGGIHLVIPVQRSIPGGLLETGIKCRSRVHYQLANLQANLKRYRSTAILLDPDGYLTEGTSGNVFFVRDGALYTPTARNILPGVTRGIVLDLAGRMGIETHEADLTPAFASTAQEIFVTSTSIGIVPAASFECVVIPHEIPGPVTKRLQQALYAEVGLDFAAQAAAYAARNPS